MGAGGDDMHRRIALVGKSVGLNSIGAGLAGRLDFDLLQYAGELADVGFWIDEVAPDAVIFDIAGTQACPVVAPMRHPGLLLIGLDLSSHEMLVLSGEQVQLATVDDLLSVLSRPGHLTELCGN